MNIKLTTIVISTILLVLSSPSSALRIAYDYSGSILYPDFDVEGTFFPEFMFGPNGRIVIDESKLPGGTLVNANVSFYYVPPIGPGSPFNIETPLGTVDDSSRVDGFLEFTLHFLPATVAYTQLEFTTDAHRNIISWWSLSLEGPPDEGTSNVYGDFISLPGGGEYIGEPGTWSGPKVIPLPASVIFLLSGVAGVWVIRLRALKSVR